MGPARNRVDGRLKVTGAAKYAVEFEVPKCAHGWTVESNIAKGKILAIDTKAAQAVPGVLAVLSHLNMPKFKEAPKKEERGGGSGIRNEERFPFSDDGVHYAGQYVALVIAETIEQARYAASLVKVSYAPEEPLLTMEAAVKKAAKPKTNLDENVQIKKGDTAAALNDASLVKIEQTYITPTETHNPIEMSGTIAHWESDKKLTLYDATQFVKGVQNVLARALGLELENVRIICPFVGGAFLRVPKTLPVHDNRPHARPHRLRRRRHPLAHRAPLLRRPGALPAASSRPMASRTPSSKSSSPSRAPTWASLASASRAFALSMIETAITLTNGEISGHDIQRVIDLAKAMLSADVQLLDYAEETVTRLAQDFPLMIITKGDLLDQESKIERSGLGRHFKHVEIVSDKNPASYAALLARHHLRPEGFLMIGNSLRSDVLPVVALGARAVHIPYRLTWAHERVSPAELAGASYTELEHLGQLPELVQRMKAEIKVRQREGMKAEGWPFPLMPFFPPAYCCVCRSQGLLSSAFPFILPPSPSAFRLTLGGPSASFILPLFLVYSSHARPFCGLQHLLRRALTASKPLPACWAS